MFTESSSQLLAFSLVALALTLAPGADTLLVLRNVLRGGSRCGMITSVGICSGLYFHALLSALGLSVLLSHSAQAFAALKTAGALYLLWLGIQSFRSTRRPSGAAELSADTFQPGKTRSFLEGFYSNILNPKAAVFYLTILPQFVLQDGPILKQSILLATLHGLMGLTWLFLLSLLFDRGRTLLRAPSVSRRMEQLCGTLPLGLGLHLICQRN